MLLRNGSGGVVQIRILVHLCPIKAGPFGVDQMPGLALINGSSYLQSGPLHRITCLPSGAVRERVLPPGPHCK